MKNKNEKMEKAAYAVHNVRALLGCLICAVRDKEHDLESTTIDEILCWQLRGSLELAYDVLDDAAFTCFEAAEEPAADFEEKELLEALRQLDSAGRTECMEFLRSYKGGGETVTLFPVYAFCM